MEEECESACTGLWLYLQKDTRLVSASDWPGAGLDRRARARRACRVESGPVDQAGQARLVTPAPVRVDVARQPLLRGYSAPERRSVVI